MAKDRGVGLPGGAGAPGGMWLPRRQRARFHQGLRG